MWWLFQSGLELARVASTHNSVFFHWQMHRLARIGVNCLCVKIINKDILHLLVKKKD